MGVACGAMLAGLPFLLDVVGRLYSGSRPLPVWLYIVFGYIPGLASVFFFGALALRKSGLDAIVGRDVLKGEVIIAERQFGHPRKVVQVALAQVQAIQIYWQAASSGNPDLGWWNAQLMLLDGREVPLGHIKGKSAAPPDRWLARFKRVSTLLDKPLERTQQTAYIPLVDLLIKNVRRQSSSRDRPLETLASSTNAKQAIYTLTAIPQDRSAPPRSIRSLYQNDETFRFMTHAMAWLCCFGASFVFTSLVTRSYWLHLLGWSITAVFFIIPFIAIFFMKPDQSEFQRDHKLAHFALLFVLYGICLIFSVVCVVIFVRSAYDLYHGPIYDRGIIERTETTCGKGCTFSIIVDGASYQVPDSRWFQTMEAGQEIEFLYGPMTHYAYPPPQSK